MGTITNGNANSLIHWENGLWPSVSGEARDLGGAGNR